MHDPQVLVLDEPLNGTDPRQRLDFHDTMTELAEQGRTILISSHILEEVETLASTILLMVSGKLAAAGDFRAIREKLDEQAYRVRVVTDSPRKMAAALAGSDDIDSVSIGEDGELEDKTLGFLALMPVARWRIVLPKVLASLVIWGPLLVISGVVATLLGFDGEIRPALAVAVALAAGVVAYAAIFTWAGLVTSRALPFALVYVLLWEGVMSTFMSGVDYLSVRGYTLGIMSGMDPSSFPALEDSIIEFPVAIGGAAVVTVLFLWLGVRRLQRMDVP